MSKTAINKFTNGLTLDTHPLVSMDTSLTNCLNGTLMTMDGNELILQNDSGNTFTNCVLPSGFIPLGMKEYNGVIYIVSKNKDTGECAIGSYPSPNYSRKGTNPTWEAKKFSLPTDSTILLLDTPYTDSDNKFIAGDTINLETFVLKIYDFNLNHKSDKFSNLIKFQGAKGSSLYNMNLYLVDNKNLYDLNYLLTDSSGFYQSEFIIPSRVSGYPRVTISLNTINNIYISDYVGKQITDDNGQIKDVGSGLLHLLFNDSFPIEENDNLFSKENFEFSFENDTSGIEFSIELYELEENGFVYKFTISRNNSNGIICDKVKIVNNLRKLGFNDSSELYFYNDKFQLTIDGVITEPVSINYFKYINVNSSLLVTYNCLLYNFKETGSLNIYISTDGESLELIRSKQLESCNGIKSIKETLDEIKNEYSFIVFTTTINDVESLIDIQYIVPYDQSIYPTLDYTNFRKDINIDTKNTGRDVNVLLTPESGSLNITESKLLTYLGGNSIELLENEISFGNLTYREQINFVLGLYNLDYKIESSMPNLGIYSLSEYLFNIELAELFNNDLLINANFIKSSTNPLDFNYSLEFPLEIGTKVCETTQYILIGTALVTDLSNELKIKQSANGELTIYWPYISSAVTTILRNFEGTQLNLNAQLKNYMQTWNKTFEGFVLISISNDVSVNPNSDGTLTQSSNNQTLVLDNSTFIKLCFVKASPNSNFYIFEYLNGEYNGSSLITNDYLFYSLNNPIQDSKIITYPKYYNDLYITTPCTFTNSGITINNKIATQSILSLANKYNETKKEYVDDYIHENVSLNAPITLEQLSQNIPDQLSYIRVYSNSLEHFIKFDDKDVVYLRYNVTKNKIEKSTKSLSPLRDTGFYCEGLNKDKQWKSESNNIWLQNDQKYYFKYGLVLTYDTYNFNTLYAR